MYLRRANLFCSFISNVNLRSLVKTISAIVILSGCQTIDFGPARKDAVPEDKYTSLSDLIPKDKVNNDVRRLVSEAVDAIDESRLAEASRKINQALKLDVTNPYLQFLNGFVYSLLAKSQDTTKAELAEMGFELSRQFDPSNWIAIYHQGLLNLERRRFDLAQRYFSEAALLNDREPGILYHLATSSYYVHDPETAAGALKRLRTLGSYRRDPRVLQASALVMAASNRPAEAQKFSEDFGEVVSDTSRHNRLNRRLADWKQFHKLGQTAKLKAPGELVVADLAVPDETDGQKLAEVKKEVSPKDDKPTNKADMVIVDVVIVRTEEKITNRKGVNLLNSLTIQFGEGDNPGLSYVRTSTKSASANIARTVVRRIEIPSITYSLNIANSNANRNEILARPSLTALNGKTSRFFSGIHINAAAISASGQGTPIEVERDVGVSMAILSKLLKSGRLILKVIAERTFLTTPNTTSITFSQRIDTSKTRVSATVNMEFGETVILSGLSEKETEYKRDGVPGLQEIPILQYGFSQEDKSDFQKSVLILLTPRRPAYTYQLSSNSEESQNTSGNKDVLNELKARYSDWFSPYPNWASVFNHMQENSLYREFRTGDVDLETWENERIRSNRIKKILEFLYY